MTSPSAGLDPDKRVAVYYTSLFLSSGVTTVGGAIWLESLGLSGSEIGTIFSVPTLIMLVMTLVVGRLSDRASDWRQAIVAGSVASGLFGCGLLLGQSFWTILPWWTLAAISQMAIVPVVDAAAVRMTQRMGRDFGGLRAYGTVGYLTMLVATGYAAQIWGAQVFLPLFIAAGLIRAALALLLPKFRGEQAQATSHQAKRLGEVMKPWFVLPLLGWSLVFATHLILNAFQGLLWQRQGLSLDVIGLLIALGALSETIMFFNFKRFAHRFPARHLILASGLVSVFRWAMQMFSPGLVPLILLQSLHAVTYCMGFLACVAFIAKWTHEDIAAEAQGFFVVMQLACAVVAVWAFGLLADRFGAMAYLLSVAIAALGCVLIYLSMRLKHPERPQPAQ